MGGRREIQPLNGLRRDSSTVRVRGARPQTPAPAQTYFNVFLQEGDVSPTLPNLAPPRNSKVRPCQDGLLIIR